MVEIVSRDEWGARPPRYTRTLATPTKDLILHHSGSSGGGAVRVRSIQRFHMDSRGWRDIAYHYLIDNDGSIFEGRGGGVEGGATYGQNQTSHAICLLGNFELEHPTSAALSSLAELVRWGHGKNWWPDRITGGHRDFRDTACPGRNLYSRIPEVNTLTQEDDMPTAEEIAKAVWQYPARSGTVGGNRIDVRFAVDRVYRNIEELTAAHRANTLGTTALAEIDDDDLDAIADAVNDELARRAAG